MLFAIIIRFNINGKKLAPYQDTKDRLRQTENIVTTLVTISIVASLFIMLQQAMNMFDLDHFEAVFLSLYLQLIAWVSLGHMLRSYPIEDINFEVYKKDASMT